VTTAASPTLLGMHATPWVAIRVTTYELIVLERPGPASDVRPEPRRSALLQRTYELIEERLGDPELSPGRLAAELFISVRTLHKLFENERTTVADWIRQRRLERCARDLLDPALADEPVGAIGARWGITSQAHFSRLFRARYGASPGAFRATMHAPS
jgi:AraC-like DNA-binding protein